MAAEIVILLIGPHGSGKTSFVKCVTGSTMDVAPTTRCREYQANVGGNAFRIIDTPGLDDLPAGNLSILKDVTQTLEKLGLSVSGAIFFHRITDGRFTGSARSSLDIFKQICGDGFAKQVAFVTSMWNKLSPAARDHHKGLNEELRQKYFHIGPGPATAFPFGNDEKGAKAVLKYFGAKGVEGKQLLLAQEVKRSGTNLSSMRRTSAGRVIMQASKNTLCTIL